MSVDIIIQIVQHTPSWVWLLLLALIALGLSQARTRELGLRRISLPPLVLLGLSLSGVVVGSFDHQVLGLAAWAAGLATTLGLARHRMPLHGAVWLPQTGLLRVPGSWLPLMLIVSVFMLKYVAAVLLARHPMLAGSVTFAVSCSLAYGGFSGLFLARALALRSLAGRSL